MMKALKGYVIVESIDIDETEDKKTEGGIFIAPVGKTEKPNVGHYKVISVGGTETELKDGDTIWALTGVVSKSTNFENEKIGILKYEHVMSVDK